MLFLFGSLVAFLAIVYWMARRAGQQAMEKELAEAKAEGLEKAKEVANEVDALSDADVTERLRKWRR